MKNKIYNMVRRFVARIATGNLGRIRVYDDEIVCYVNGNKIKEQNEFVNSYRVVLTAISAVHKLYKRFGVDKPVHYMVQNVNFDKKIDIITSKKNCHVTFKKCQFTSSVLISAADHITFNDCKFRLANPGSDDIQDEFVIETNDCKSSVNKIEFIHNDLIVHSDVPFLSNGINLTKAEDSNKKLLKMGLSAKKITISCCRIEDAESIAVNTDSFVADNSFVKAKMIEVRSGYIKCFNNEITSGVISVTYSNYGGELMNINCNSMIVNRSYVSQTDGKLGKKGVSKGIKPGRAYGRPFNVRRRPPTKVLRKKWED